MIPSQGTGHFQEAGVTLTTPTCCIPPSENLKKSVESTSAESTSKPGCRRCWRDGDRGRSF